MQSEKTFECEFTNVQVFIGLVQKIVEAQFGKDYQMIFDGTDVVVQWER